MGQSFRHKASAEKAFNNKVLIPNEWGNHSDFDGNGTGSRDGLVLIPDEWGNHSDFKVADTANVQFVLIPDEWGNHSDAFAQYDYALFDVLIPDEWGNHSDRRTDKQMQNQCLNPR